MQPLIDIIFHHGLIWHEMEHFLFALPFAILLYCKIKSKKMAIRQVFILFLVAYFLDADHLFDYFLYYGFHFSSSDFFRLNYFTPHGISLVPFHAWEWIGILGYISYKKGWKSIWTSITLGMLSHLILDSFNVESVVFYSIIYRSIHLIFG